MAERRMFAKTIIDSDAFLDMPMSARLLYYDLSMRADDDGFINSPKKIMRFIGATNDDMNILIMRKFVLPFDNGIVVIKHWRIHNYIRKDTYTETPYKEQKAMLELDENKAYRMTNEKPLKVGCDGYVDEPSTQVRIGKDSIGEYSYIGADDQPDKTLDQIKEIIDYLNNKLGSKYSYKTASTKKHINARLAEGHTIEEFKLVIDKKYDEWHKDERMSKFLRPETLFGTKFEGYLNQPTVKGSGSKKNGFADFEGKQDYDFDEIEKMILSK